MANRNRISAIFANEAQVEVMSDITDIIGKMPFLITTSPDNKPGRVMGPKSVEYVNLCLAGALQYPTKMTGDFDVVEYGKDVTLFKQLTPVRILVASLLRSIDNTMSAASSDSMLSSDDVYDNLKKANEKDGTAKDLVAQIAQRFAAQGKTRPVK